MLTYCASHDIIYIEREVKQMNYRMYKLIGKMRQIGSKILDGLPKLYARKGVFSKMIDYIDDKQTKNQMRRSVTGHIFRELESRKYTIKCNNWFNTDELDYLFGYYHNYNWILAQNKKWLKRNKIKAYQVNAQYIINNDFMLLGFSLNEIEKDMLSKIEHEMFVFERL